MPAYVIADIEEILDPEDYATYREQAPAIVAAHGGRYLARGGATEPLEGGWLPTRAVIVEFPSMAVFRAWWNSAEYQAIRPVRVRSTRSRLIVTEGL